MRIKTLQFKTLLIFCLLVSSCGSSEVELNEENISGIWKVTSFDVDTEELAPQLINTVRSSQLSSTYTFGSDGAYAHQSSLPLETGTWSLQANEKKLSFANKGGESAGSFVIAKLTENSMILSQELGPLGSIKMTLKRK
ncbi:MAG: lipocalin family protein [Bacteroidota bacterium]